LVSCTERHERVPIGESIHLPNSDVRMKVAVPIGNLLRKTRENQQERRGAV
jgi:hypothetical protein